MSDGKRIFLNSLKVFGLLIFLLLVFGFFINPNLELTSDKDVLPVSDVLSVLDTQNPYSYECPETFPVIEVPNDFMTIQEAIDSVTTGAIILVSPGIYNENLVLRPNICIIAEEFGKSEIQGFSDTVIQLVSNNQIKNFKISSLGKAEVGISVSNAEMVSVAINSLDNFKYGILSDGDSKLSVFSNVFRNVDYAFSIENGLFFLEQSNIEATDTAVDISNSEGEVLGLVMVGGRYGVKAENSNVFFDKNIFKEQDLAGMQLSTEGDYEIGDNFFENVNEEILY